MTSIVYANISEVSKKSPNLNPFLLNPKTNPLICSQKFISSLLLLPFARQGWWYDSVWTLSWMVLIVAGSKLPHTLEAYARAIKPQSQDLSCHWTSGNTSDGLLRSTQQACNCFFCAQWNITSMHAIKHVDSNWLAPNSGDTNPMISCTVQYLNKITGGSKFNVSDIIQSCILEHVDVLTSAGLCQHWWVYRSATSLT